MRISDWSSDVCSSDLAIREGLYRRTASLIGYDGALSGMHPTGRALEQLRAHFQVKPSIYRSNLKKVSRRFGALSVHDQESVIRELLKKSEEHTSELQSLLRISYAVFCLKKQTQQNQHTH